MSEPVRQAARELVEQMSATMTTEALSEPRPVIDVWCDDEDSASDPCVDACWVVACWAHSEGPFLSTQPSQSQAVEVADEHGSLAHGGTYVLSVTL